ncbi:MULTISPECIES: winged helix-turn-helix transcriptional regulator [Enterococcus]|uniref:MarR family transcriptional regulator n=2 Tax=root TaxID=1 RepID=A0A179ES22_ENTTH|nr:MULTISPECIES: helix-turn-helix domain-containing protein [Enterococcus]ASZ08258.1 transcriptional regulator [Enterococcus thailandicus]MDA3965806.1 helix-turn-helix domain-containing protein [Enterococcus thailandicus]MDA3973880.1 helix-turn-helix domain-containing protein [Enterococcus thailandicus]MDA3976307.1 helix-turn-helix domain-containing protein [Enterococcus thailandicus]MDA3981272.1 helix-turn-helix domain-containing protein [Enterococcus thailandicus]
MEKIYHIGVEATLEVIGGKWKPIILCHLGNGAIRTGELRRKIPTITQKMLTQQLRELEQDGIVHRKIYNQVPPKVEYSLTEEGKSLREILVAMSVWGEERIEKQQEEGKSVKLLHTHGGYLNY